jgi:tetratricopeptide (TPR) repeat protein
MRVVAAALCAGLAACATAPSPRPSSDAYSDYLIGRIANLRDDHGAAADRYFAALARAPRDEALLAGAIAASLASGDVERARRAARAAPRVDAPAYAHLVRAADALRVERWNVAAEELDRVEGTAAEELLARLTMVWARTAQGRPDDVLVDLAPLAQIRPYGSLLAYQQAMALDYSGRSEAAAASYQQAVQNGLWMPAAIERYADLLVRRGAADEARALLNLDISRADPALAAAQARLDAGGAVAGAPLTPAKGAAIGLYGMSLIFQQEGDAGNALAALTLALMLDPDFDGARLLFAQQQSRLGHPELARTALTQVAPASPFVGPARVLDSWIVFDSGAHEEAIELARVNAQSGELRAMRALADMHRSLDQYGEAEAAYSALIERSPNDWRLHFARGAARERLGRWPEAETDLQRALQLSPDQPDVMNYLGYSWVDRGDRLSEGMALIRRAVELRPNSGAIIDSLGWAYYRQGDYARALDYIERAVELEPADATLNDHLGDVYWRVGRRIEARFQWRRALTLSPDNSAPIQEKLDNGLPAAPPTQSANR